MHELRFTLMSSAVIYSVCCCVLRQCMTCLLCLGVWLINVGNCRITKCTTFAETDFTSLQLNLVPRGMLLFLDVPSGGMDALPPFMSALSSPRKAGFETPSVHARPYPCPAKKTQGGLMKTQALLLPSSCGDPHHRSFHAAL